MAAALIDMSYTCKVAFRGRNPQIVACCVWNEVVHRTCLPEELTSTDYVRMKKYKEAFNFKCTVCFGRLYGTTSPNTLKRKAKKQPALKKTETSNKRVRQVPDKEPAQHSSINPPRVVSTRPSAIVLSSLQETRVFATSTPLDEPLPFNQELPQWSRRLINRIPL
jgi:hypothetical protein